ncbi:hypothetical protein OUZ56_029274 [Daphnia magna]|uniref:Uncharacterized protein n=1 Tax=Daphnia magna TaxID=35525 RepID=A0ABR0B6C9_9CRUS|nr:hypothetical protein OUZ56_029274 [Daphnia magna]
MASQQSMATHIRSDNICEWRYRIAQQRSHVGKRLGKYSYRRWLCTNGLSSYEISVPNLMLTDYFSRENKVKPQLVVEYHCVLHHIACSWNILE